MPGFFSGYEIVAETKNFLVTCEDDPGARQRAQSIGATCEADLFRLNQLFSTNFAAGMSSPHSIWVVVLKDDPSATANGWNYGYEAEESSQIWIRRAFTAPPPPPPSLFPPDPPPLSGPDLNAAVIEFPRFVFVAELAEILMGFTGYGWDAGASPGEGLSNLLGALLHPRGYYDAGQGPRINQWLNGGSGNSPRFDFVTTTKNTDQDIYSYGCAILFINYLVYQRGIPLEKVIRAGGSTLAETYSRVTGEPASAAYPAFNALLAAHIRNSTTNSMRRDNIFPLLDAAHRSIQTTQGDPIDKGHFDEPNSTSFVVKPGLMCPPSAFDFFKHEQMVEQPIFAVARGMANARFNWSIDDVPAPVHGSWTQLTVNSPLTIKNPDGTVTTVANTTTLLYGILDVWNASVLYLKTLNRNGNTDLSVKVFAREAVELDGDVSAEESVSLTTVTWSAGEKLKDARKRCNPFYAEVNDSLWHLTEKLSDLKNRPDPPYERAVREIVHEVERLQKAVVRYSHAGGQTRSETWRQLGNRGELRSIDPVSSPLSLSRMRLPSVTHGQDRERSETE
ncbi:hypothetical protein ABIE89_000479 [Bradyrhizobium niftali]|uniref:hypothetical protein n=1 Tax=Bradyrhizobium niftali TaxID=2560055 RepID=UPI00383945C5